MGEVFDVVVVGAGFAGLYALHRFRTLGFSACVVEAGADVGGTWFWNRYPGARCDVESLEYSYSFSEELQQEWEWTERYSAQPEILRYLNHVADRFALRDGVRLRTRVEAATYDEANERWRVRTDAGQELDARFLVMATGCLSSTHLPQIGGIEEFTRPVLHTGRWPQHPVDFTNQRVAVIGTGSSGIQAIPLIAEQAAELFVFQRTPQYSIPARNRPLDAIEQAAVKADYAGLRARNRQSPTGFGSRYPRNTVSALAVSGEERQRVYEARWELGGTYFLGAFADIMTDPAANDTAAEFVRVKIRETVRDPAVAARLLPDTPIGCKRICLDTGYFETYNRPNVHLVDVREEPIVALFPNGLRTTVREYGLDALVFATGFDAMTGALLSIDIRGRGGRALREAWAVGPVTFLGLGVPEFPNLFLVTGPGSPSVLANMVGAIEQHVDWIASCLDVLRTEGVSSIEADRDAAERWGEHVDAVAAATLFSQCNSWYVGANIPGKPRRFLPLLGFPAYVARCDEVAAIGYDGFRRNGPRR